MVGIISIAIIGLIALAIGGSSFLKRGPDITPSGATLDVKKFVPNPEIAAVEGQIKTVQSFISRTFFQNPNAGETAFQRRQRINRIPRNIRFQTFPRGFRQGVNPFTGQKLALPVGPRGSAKTIAFAGGQAQLDANQRLITFGLETAAQSNTLLSSLQEKLGLLPKTIIVNV